MGGKLIFAVHNDLITSCAVKVYLLQYSSNLPGGSSVACLAQTDQHPLETKAYLAYCMEILAPWCYCVCKYFICCN